MYLVNPGPGHEVRARLPARPPAVRPARLPVRLLPARSFVLSFRLLSPAFLLPPARPVLRPPSASRFMVGPWILYLYRILQ